MITVIITDEETKTTKCDDNPKGYSYPFDSLTYMPCFCNVKITIYLYQHFRARQTDTFMTCLNCQSSWQGSQSKRANLAATTTKCECSTCDYQNRSFRDKLLNSLCVSRIRPTISSYCNFSENISHNYKIQQSANSLTLVRIDDTESFSIRNCLDVKIVLRQFSLQKRTMSAMKEALNKYLNE